MSQRSALSAVPLYRHVDRVARGLAAQGIGPGEAIPPEALFGLDQWHYHGIDAIAAAARFLGLGAASRVLDIGSGVGGPARYLAHATGCHVTAVELQRELHDTAVDLTRRSGLADRVAHVCGDALEVDLPSRAFDAAIAFLAILHVPDRPRLLRRLHAALKPGGGLYVEDLAERAPFAPADRQDLLTTVHGVSVSTIDAYAADLRAAGFVDVVATDLTPDWKPFAAERLAAWRADRAEISARQGEGAWAAQEQFYAVIDRLYRGGGLAGVRLTAKAG